MAVILALLNALLSDVMINYSFGSDYRSAAPILAIYGFSNVFVFMNNASWQWFLNLNLQALAAYRLMLGAILNIILNLYLIPKYGLLGAAYATLISYGFSSYFFNILFKNSRRNFFLQTKAIILMR